MTATVTKRFRFEMGHRLQNHPGQCCNLHGHSYELEVGVTGEVDSITGMVLDFSDLKRAVQPIVDQWDHAMLLDTEDPLFQVLDNQGLKLVAFLGPPTAENMAWEIARQVRVALSPRVQVTQVRVKLHETADSWAEVTW